MGLDDDACGEDGVGLKVVFSYIEIINKNGRSSRGGFQLA